MKKVLLTAAIGCALMTPAFAQAPENYVQGGLPFEVEDYFKISPNGTFPPDINKIVFETPQEMVAGKEGGVGTFKVTASRSWTVTYRASDFERTQPETFGITQFVPVEDVFQVYTTSTDPLVTNLHSSGTPLTVLETEQDLVKGWGGVDRPYTITGRVTLGTAMETMNLSGTYVSTVNHLLSLD